MKKSLILFALLTLSVGLWAETQKVSYLFRWTALAEGIWLTGEQVATVVTNETSSLSEGWYVVTGEDVRTGTLTCSGKVRLILTDGAKLTVTGDWGNAGIQVSGSGNSLAVYAQSTGEQMGQLIANGAGGGAGIGGNNMQSGSNITINGGKVTATGNLGAAGIGGGANGEGSNITINGGIVNATGSDAGNTSGAGIGGGGYADGSNITINGGTVTATGGNLGAGIGGGTRGVGHDIFITGGFVTALGTNQGAGIGAGTWTGAYSINISGGLVVAKGGWYGGAGIGGGSDSKEVHNISITGGAVVATAGWDASAIGRGDGQTSWHHDIFVSSSLKMETNGELIAHTSNEDVSTKCNGKKDLWIYSYQPVTYGEYISVNPDFSTGDEVKEGTQVTFTAENREDDCFTPLFFSDPECTKAITDGVSGHTYTTYVPVNPLSVYVKYIELKSTVTYGEYITVDPNFNSGDVVDCGKPITFTATNREADGYRFVGFFSDPECTRAITEGISDYTYTVTVGHTPVTVYASYSGYFAVDYIDANGDQKTCSNAKELTNTSLRQNLEEGWYVVRGSDVQFGEGFSCSGDVHIILADGAKLTATGMYPHTAGWQGTPGIEVSGNGNSLTIYGQIGQSGQLIASGGYLSAGIGGINSVPGSNIIINGGKVTANGGGYSDGIIASEVFVNTWCILKAGGFNPPTTVIDNNGGNLAESLKDKQYVTIEPAPKSDLTTENIVISSNSATYNGEAKSATVTFNDGITGAGQIILTYKQNGEEVTPVNAGEYDIYVAVTAGVRYNALPATKLNGQLTITKAALTVDNFTYTAPSNTYYNGKPREAKVEPNSQGKTGVGTITAIKYNDSPDAPTALGEYAVSISVAEGANYNAATGLTDEAWKFTIKGWSTPEPSNPVAVEIVKDGKAVYSVSTPDQVKYYKSDSKVEIIQNNSIVYSAENPEGVRYTHSYVDLGLPSGMLWATYNIGATKPEEYGDYYAWGDPSKKTEFYWKTYPYGSSVNNCTKYQKDDKWTLEPEDDMATVNWGSHWRVPTKSNFKELFEQCDTVFTTYEGVYGLMLISKANGKTLFLPAAGNRDGNSLDHAGKGLYYWSSTVVSMSLGYVFWLQNSGSMSSYSGYRYCGFSVRPVYDPFVALTAADFVISDNNYTYDGEPKTVSVSMADESKLRPSGNSMTIYYNNDKSLQPKDAGTYQVYIDIVGDNHYNDVKGLTSEAWKFTIEKATPTADMFTYTAPSNLYDNVDSHEATVTFNNQNGKLTGMGTVIVKYNDSPDAPTDLGDYAVSISVDEGTNYKAAEKLSDEAWKFTIKKFAPDGVKAVDLGLPSGLKWANVNIDDLDDEERVGFFTWEEATNPDVATTNWGDNWRLPTKEEFQELIDNCTWKWVNDEDYGWGYNVSSKTNDNFIILPAYGYYQAHYGEGYYWSSSIDNDNESNAYLLYFSDKEKSVSSHSRYTGCSIRPVLKSNGK